MEEGRPRLKTVKTRNSKTFLSNLFVDYQQSFDFNDDIIMRRNTDRISIVPNQINNSIFIE